MQWECAVEEDWARDSEFHLSREHVGVFRGPRARDKDVERQGGEAALDPMRRMLLAE